MEKKLIGWVIESDKNKIEAIGYFEDELDHPLAMTIEGDISPEELKTLGINYVDEDMSLDELKTSLVHLNRYVKQYGKIMKSVY